MLAWPGHLFQGVGSAPEPAIGRQPYSSKLSLYLLYHLELGSILGPSMFYALLRLLLILKKTRSLPKIIKQVSV